MNDTTPLRTCTTCKTDKPLSEFYIQHNGKPSPVCKVCHSIRQKRYMLKSKKDASTSHEQTCMEYMRSLGIYTVPGKASEFTWVDLVVWGFIRVEVKLGSSPSDGTWFFSFSDAQVKRRLLADVIVLIIPRETWEYYIFEASHPAFYKNGRLKTGVIYLEYPKHRKNRKDTVPLTREMMKDAKDSWSILLAKLPNLKAVRKRTLEVAASDDPKQRILF